MAVNLSDPSWAPVGESALDLFIERSNLVGVVLGGVCYGAFVTLWFTCVRYELKGKPAREVSFGLLAYLAALLAAATVYFACSVKWLQQMFIDYRNYHIDSVPPSPESTGPLGFYNYDYDTPMIVTANAAYVVLNFLADGLLLHRCYVIWNSNKAVMALPGVVFLASTALSIATVINNAHPAAMFFGQHAKALATAWVVLSMALNIGLTLLIVGRLLHARRTLVKVLGKQHARLYSGIAAMLVESAALYALVSALFLAFYEQSGPAAQFVNVLLPMLTMAMALAPVLILARVARGRAWRASTARASTAPGSTGVSIGRSIPFSHRVSMPGRAVGYAPESKTRVDDGGAVALAVLKTQESVVTYI